MDADETDATVTFDPEAALGAARDAVDEEDILIVVAYDSASFETVYVDDRVRALYPDEDAMEEHFGQIHSYVHLDFTERDLFDELFIEPGGIDSFVTYMGNLIAARIVSADQGFFIALAPGTEVTPVVDAVSAELS